MKHSKYLVEPSPDRFSGPYYVCRKEEAGKDDYKMESHHYLSNAFNAADYLGKAYPKDRYYVVRIKDES
tara:strand:+ start:2529 stop:2735 length:207 start_codon:yes stop_codon:yes gene_type:complete